MGKRVFGLFIFLFAFSVINAQTVLKKGLIITKNTKIKKDTYYLDSYDSVSQSVIVIEGENIIVDFSGCVLNGNSKRQTPDRYVGIAIIVRKGKNITIKNLTAKGFKVALLVKNVDGLKIENCDFSYNYRQHLNSSQENEDVSDWLSYHHNENDEWLRYGAAIYLKDCKNFTVSNCKVTGGQNALMMIKSNNGIIYNNDFSFNSGVGIGMYRSSGNKI